MIEAEEKGVTQANVVEQMTSTRIRRPALARRPGQDIGKVLGLEEGWAYNIVKQVGNYGESFERNLGQGRRSACSAALNNLWSRAA